MNIVTDAVASKVSQVSAVLISFMTTLHKHIHGNEVCSYLARGVAMHVL